MALQSEARGGATPQASQPPRSARSAQGASAGEQRRGGGHGATATITIEDDEDDGGLEEGPQRAPSDPLPPPPRHPAADRLYYDPTARNVAELVQPSQSAATASETMARQPVNAAVDALVVRGTSARRMAPQGQAHASRSSARPPAPPEASPYHFGSSEAVDVDEGGAPASDVADPPPRAAQQSRQPAPLPEQRFERFELQTRRVFLGKWNCGPTPVVLKVDRQHPHGQLEFFPADGHGLKGQYPYVLYDLGACTRFEVDKSNGTLCFWAMWEPPFMDLLGLDTYAPFVSQDQTESSLYIEYDKKAYEDGAPHWPSQFVRLPHTALRSRHRSRSCASPHLLHTHCTLPLTQLRRRDHVRAGVL